MTDIEIFKKIERVIGYQPNEFSGRERILLEEAYDKAKKERDNSVTGESFIINKNKFTQIEEIYSLFMDKITN